jgi:anti-sigma factor ChrR (cupin superfamily)
MHPPDHPKHPPAAAPAPDVLPDFLVLLLSDPLVPPAPDQHLAERVKNRLLGRIQSGHSMTPPQVDLPEAQHRLGLVTARAGQGAWVELLPKVHARLLYTDGQSQSYLVRLEAGARNGPHKHADLEECLVLEGRIDYDDGSFLAAGDYQAALSTAVHPGVRSDHGALLFLRYARPIENYLGL